MPLILIILRRKRLGRVGTESRAHVAAQVLDFGLDFGQTRHDPAAVPGKPGRGRVLAMSFQYGGLA
jgi:hypothetical protein